MPKVNADDNRRYDDRTVLPMKMQKAMWNTFKRKDNRTI
jgi:hypothetical protein